jgi:heme-degrading monooxygenase HmoA
MGFHLAQANIALLRAPSSDPSNAAYVARLDEMNALADGSPGFVWRYLTDSRDPSQREFDDPLVLFNMSVWESLEALHAYTYRTAHSEVYARRKTWFDEPEAPTGLGRLACWWVPVGERPTVAEAKRRLRAIREKGPTAEAFTFKTPFDATGAPVSGRGTADRNSTPAGRVVPG